MSIPPRVSWSGGPSSTRSASRIIPAHEPYAGSPARSAARSGSRIAEGRASLSIVVDSPPGSTMPSRPASSSARRTAASGRTRPLQGGQVLAHVALQGEHADRRGVTMHQPREPAHCKRSRRPVAADPAAPGVSSRRRRLAAGRPRSRSPSSALQPGHEPAAWPSGRTAVPQCRRPRRRARLAGPGSSDRGRRRTGRCRSGLGLRLARADAHRRTRDSSCRHHAHASRPPTRPATGQAQPRTRRIAIDHAGVVTGRWVR